MCSLSQRHDPNQPHTHGPVITFSLTDSGPLWPRDQTACGLTVCHWDSCRDPRHPETHSLDPSPKNSHTDPITVIYTFRCCTASCSNVHMLTASESHSRRNTVTHHTTKRAHTWPQGQSTTREATQSQRGSHGLICPVCSWLSVIAWLTQILMEGARGRNMGNREMRCGDMGKEDAHQSRSGTQ